MGYDHIHVVVWGIFWPTWLADCFLKFGKIRRFIFIRIKGLILQVWATKWTVGIGGFRRCIPVITLKEIP